MKKNRLYIFLLIILVGIATALYLKKGGDSSIKSKLKDFAVSDTASIDKVVISDKSGKILVLTKKNKIWYGNDSVKVRRDIIGILLETIKRVEVKTPVNKAMRANLMKQLATGSVQVEIYTDGSLEKKYFVGGPTMDGFGTFMLLEGADDPFITHIPGFDGYLTVRFNPDINVWRDKEIFRIAPQDLKIVQIAYPSSKESSFTLNIEDRDYIKLVNMAGDTAKSGINAEFLRNYTVAFADVQYENIADPKKINLNELLIPQNLLAIVTVFDKEGTKRTIELYKRYYNGEKFLPNSEEYDFDRDRCFVRLNGIAVYNGQYRVFNKLIVSYKDFFSAPIK